LRTKFPEVNFSADVIRSHITEDALHSTELTIFDPLEGNILDIVAGYNREKFLVFPTGELGAELRKSPHPRSLFGAKLMFRYDPYRGRCQWEGSDQTNSYS